MRRLLAPKSVRGALAAVLLGHACTGGCSSASSLSGGGGCEAFCSKFIGARCRNTESKERCLLDCRDRQTRCPRQANALMKCATVEAQIACETGSGQPRVVGCLAREIALQECVTCDRFCENWSSLECPLGPAREECVATCLDPRCHAEHRRIAECMAGVFGSCGADGRPQTSGCAPAHDAAANCTAPYGQPQPFRWLPVEQSDAGTTKGG